METFDRIWIEDLGIGAAATHGSNIGEPILIDSSWGALLTTWSLPKPVLFQLWYASWMINSDTFPLQFMSSWHDLIHAIKGQGDSTVSVHTMVNGFPLGKKIRHKINSHTTVNTQVETWQQIQELRFREKFGSLNLSWGFQACTQFIRLGNTCFHQLSHFPSWMTFNLNFKPKENGE